MPVTLKKCTLCPPGTHGEFGSPTRPYDVVTIGHGGYTGLHRCNGHGSTSGYGHGFRAHGRTAPDTLIVDKTFIDDGDLIRFACSGAMLGIHLPDGFCQPIGSPPVPIEHFTQAGPFDYVALDLYVARAVELGAAVYTGDLFVCDQPWGTDTLCGECRAVADGRCSWCGGDDMHGGSCRRGEPMRRTAA